MLFSAPFPFAPECMYTFSKGLKTRKKSFGKMILSPIVFSDTHRHILIFLLRE